MAGTLRIRQAILPIRVFLLFASLQSAYCQVEPPANVTFHCHNLHDLLTWSYDRPVTGLRFRVEIFSLNSNPVVVWVDPPDLHANLSLLTDPVDDNMPSVTAVVGQNESLPVDGLKFSYFRGTLAEQQCSVDFPPVAVSVDLNHYVLFEFTHPWVWYGSSLPRAKSRQKKSNQKMQRSAPEFTYTVKVNEDLEENLECYTHVCEGKLPVVPGRDRQCLNFEGVMQTMYVRGSQEYCASPHPPLSHESNRDNYIIACVLPILVMFGFAVVGLIVYKKKTSPSSLLPTATSVSSQRRLGPLKLSKDLVLVPELEPRSPRPLLSDETGDGDLTPVGPSNEPDVRFRLGVENEVVGVGYGGGSEYMPGSDLEAPADESSYEKRPVVTVELGPGDAAEGYRLGGL